MAYGCRSVQWCFIMIHMVDTQYSDVVKEKEIRKIHGNLPD